MAISEPFARILTAGRAQFNSRVAEVRRRVPGFDSEAFGLFLESSVDLVVVAVAEQAPDRAVTTAIVAYDIALVLTAQALTGAHARSALVGRTWRELVPLLGRQVAEQPREVLGALSNAAVFMSSNPVLRGDEWLNHMVSLAGQTQSVDELLALGQLLSWRAGATQFRESALAAADRLPEALALKAVGAAATAGWPSVRQQLQANPWWLPDSPSGRAPRPRRARLFGEFTGLGGAFSQPPELRACATGFLVKSHDRYGLLLADAWGAVLFPTSSDVYAAPATGGVDFPPVLKGASLVFADEVVAIDLPAEGLRMVANDHTVALTSPYTHRIHLFPLQ
ncbi:MAG: hypothetical protein IPG34_13540 [Rhodocyclaceae bacterium]|nr:hypothetical protein [Rhodocyclaceae bacterium]